jgi:hypothetical protein
LKDDAERNGAQIVADVFDRKGQAGNGESASTTHRGLSRWTDSDSSGPDAPPAGAPAMVWAIAFSLRALVVPAAGARAHRR